MTTYRTGNAIGSADPRDLYDNAENLDELVNSQDKAEHPDRLGVPRKTWYGMEGEFDGDQARRENEHDADQTRREGEFQAAQADKQQRFNALLAASGYQFVGDYAAGIELTEYNQLVRDENGEFWRVSGQVDLPYVTTGTGLPEGGALMPIGDGAIRQEVALGDAFVFSSTGSEPIKDALNRRPISVNNVNQLMALDRTYLEDGQAVVVARNGTYIWNAAQSEFKLASTPSRTSFVDKLKDSSNCMGMFYNPTSSGDSFTLGWTFRGGNGVRASASISLNEDAAGWMRPSSVLEGPASNNIPIGGGFDINFQGTKASANNSTYTTTVGDTFTAVVTGASVRFYSYADPRGGVWRITVGGRSRDISVWRPSAGFVFQDVIDGLDPNVTHIVTGEFIGEDPNNAPSSGSARGWLWYADESGGFPSEARAISNQIKDSLGAPSPTSSLQDVGIREFAMRVFEVGQDASSSSWIPSHDGQIINVGSVEKRMSIDGRDVSLMSLPARMEVHNNFVIEQSFRFKHATGTEALGRLTTRHTFNNDGTVNFDYRVTALRDFNVDIWYGANFSPDGTSGWADELVLNNGTRIDLSNYSPGQLEEYAVTSAAYLGQSSNGWYQGIAIDVDLPEMLATSVHPDQSRSPMNIAATRKLYWLTSSGGGMTMRAGESYSARIRWGYFVGIQSPNELGGEKSLI